MQRGASQCSASPGIHPSCSSNPCPPSQLHQDDRAGRRPERQHHRPDTAPAAGHWPPRHSQRHRSSSSSSHQHPVRSSSSTRSPITTLSRRHTCWSDERICSANSTDRQPHSTRTQARRSSCSLCAASCQLELQTAARWVQPHLPPRRPPPPHPPSCPLLPPRPRPRSTARTEEVPACPLTPPLCTPAPTISSLRSTPAARRSRRQKRNSTSSFWISSKTKSKSQVRQRTPRASSHTAALARSQHGAHAVCAPPASFLFCVQMISRRCAVQSCVRRTVSCILCRCSCTS